VSTMSLGDIIRIDDRTVLVIGQELDVDQGQPDVANTLLHRVGRSLFMIDTGVTERFRAALSSAVDEVGEWTELIVLTTHGHPDHVGNNDLPDELAEARGARVQHFVPARDVAQMRDPQGYWTTSFDRLVGVVPLPAPPNLVAWKITSLFRPYRPFGQTTRTFEQLPLERLNLGSATTSGWTFADGAVHVIRTQGHCAGHVVVYLRDSRLIHMGDETNGPCGVMHDADQVKLQTAFALARQLADQGLVTTMTDAHGTTVRDTTTARAELETLFDHALAVEAAAVAATNKHGSIDAATYAADHATRLADIGFTGANSNPMFRAMAAVNAASELGVDTNRSWSPPDVTVVEASALRTVCRALAGSPSLVPWLYDAARSRTRARLHRRIS
jgi:glyoxylase-like metal-dependent hydrolase (beta-lactamase superfamily II)